MEKNDPNLPDFERVFFIKLAVFIIKFQQEAKNVGTSVFFLLSYLVCSQIWLNYFVNDDHFDYVTKSLKKTLVQHVNMCNLVEKLCLKIWATSLVNRYYCSQGVWIPILTLVVQHALSSIVKLGHLPIKIYMSRFYKGCHQWPQ